MSVKFKYLNYEIIKMNSTVAFQKNYITHFFRQFVALKKISLTVYIFMHPCLSVTPFLLRAHFVIEAKMS